MRSFRFLYVLFSVCIISACNKGKTEDSAKGKVQIDTMQHIMSVKQCSRLYTAEYLINKIVLKNDAIKLKGNVFQHKFNVDMPMGERKILIPIDVTLKAYIDFGTFSEKNVIREGEHITIVLPDPKVVVTSSKIDHKEVKSFVDFTRSDFTSAEKYNFARQGLESVLKTVPEIGIIETARENAVNMIVPMLVGLGYKQENIVISFSDSFLQKKYPEIYDSEGRTIKFK